MKRTLSFVLWLLVWWIGVLFFGSSYLQWNNGQQEIGLSLPSLVTNDSIIEKYKKIDDILDNEYYDKWEIDKDVMIENALKWYVDAIGDPYTVYLTTDENALFDEEMAGEKNFEGIGAVVTKKEDGVLIEEVLKWFPASKAGLRHLDVILEIDGESTQPLTIGEAVKLIRGPKWSEVTLTIYRAEENTIDKYVVKRDAVNVPSVRGELLTIDGKSILYIEIAIIGDDTIMSLRNIVSEYTWQTEWVILDLRGNGWWYLPLAVDVASFFLPKNELVTTARYTTIEDEVYRSKGYQLLEWLPTVVLVDGLSASAAEIIAGALEQRGDAVLVGTQTFGKWSIQTIREIDNGSSLKYTIGKRYLPDDSNVDKEWILPRKEVEFDVEAYQEFDTDNQLDTAKDEITILLNQ